MTTAMIVKYNQRCDMNWESTLLREQFKRFITQFKDKITRKVRFSAKVFQLTTVTTVEGKDQWQGFVQTIKLCVKKEVAPLRKGINELLKKISDFH